MYVGCGLNDNTEFILNMFGKSPQTVFIRQLLNRIVALIWICFYLIIVILFNLEMLLVPLTTLLQIKQLFYFLQFKKKYL